MNIAVVSLKKANNRNIKEFSLKSKIQTEGFNRKRGRALWRRNYVYAKIVVHGAIYAMDEMGISVQVSSVMKTKGEAIPLFKAIISICLQNKR